MTSSDVGAELDPQGLRNSAARIAWGKLPDSGKRLETLQQLVVKSPGLFVKAGSSADVLKDVANFDELPECVAAKLGRYASVELGACFKF